MSKLKNNVEGTFKQREASLNKSFAKHGPVQVLKAEGKRNKNLNKEFDVLEDHLHVKHKERD